MQEQPRVQWCAKDELLPALRSIRTEPQTLILTADLEGLRRDIPVPPALIPPSEGPPGPMYEWYGRVNGRPIVVEYPVIDPDLGYRGATITTPYDESGDATDWTVIKELEGVSSALLALRPIFIQSRSTSDEWVVHRIDPRGWEADIYRGASRQDAEALIQYLQRDSWNHNCFVRDARVRSG